MARHPKPKAVKQLEGNPGKRELVGIDLPPGVPDCPAHLPDEARAEFFRVTSVIKSYLAEADRMCLAAYCFYWAEWVRLCDVVRESGDVVSTDGGGVKANPLIAKREECARQMASFGARLGLSPADRSKIHSDGDEDMGDWGDLIA